MCPGASKEARLNRNEGTKRFLTNFHFFFASIFPIHISFFFYFYRSYHFPTFSFLKPQPFRAVLVMCDGSVYHIDVEEALQLLNNFPYANSGTKISVHKEGFLACFKHDKSNKS